MQEAYRGTITVVSAANLAAWVMGGFKALVLAFRKCQYCMVIDEDIRKTKVCKTASNNSKLENFITTCRYHNGSDKISTCHVLPVSLFTLLYPKIIAV